ncbi:zonular occludens toxin domain-containing protein [Acinetobacter higginsii]|uniref:zonular occludens toxin domain-containing protein n=1 Tax=Acinetobacter higginsii TaxID=70347 RepID=UPI001F4AFFDE|nr:zonular occludens toxin domain-containing protein [Acinetobacter higginsii]MCH7382157.1 zonular occludens toxin domain-containing protein [Acinetobacter higginsii]
MQYLISAPPRTGKSLYVVNLIDKLSKQYPDRLIVTNIIGMNYPGVISMTSTINKPADWRDWPNGTIFIYDECHEHPAFSSDDLLKELWIDEKPYDERISKINARADINSLEKKNLIDSVNKERKMALVKKKEGIYDIARSLTLHAHFGFDIYLITQDVTRVNATTLAATGRHLVLRRLFGWDMMFIYEYYEVQKYFAGSTRKNAISIKLWFYKKNLYKYYISSEEHNVPKTIPWMLVCMLALLVGVVYTAYTKWQNGKYGNKQKAAAVEASNHNNNSQQAEPVWQKDEFGIDVKYTKSGIPTYRNQQDEERAYLLRQEAKRAGTVNSNGQQPITGQYGYSSQNDQAFAYDVRQPYATDYAVSYQVVEKPRLAGCMIMKNKCSCYTQQATKIDMSQSDCKRYMSGDKPFDYFTKQQEQRQLQQAPVQYQAQVQNQQSVQQFDAEYFAKMQEAKRQGLI